MNTEYVKAFHGEQPARSAVGTTGSSGTRASRSSASRPSASSRGGRRPGVPDLGVLDVRHRPPAVNVAQPRPFRLDYRLDQPTTWPATTASTDGANTRTSALQHPERLLLQRTPPGLPWVTDEHNTATSRTSRCHALRARPDARPGQRRSDLQSTNPSQPSHVAASRGAAGCPPASTWPRHPAILARHRGQSLYTNFCSRFPCTFRSCTDSLESVAMLWTAKNWPGCRPPPPKLVRISNDARSMMYTFSFLPSAR